MAAEGHQALQKRRKQRSCDFKTRVKLQRTKDLRLGGGETSRV